MAEVGKINLKNVASKLQVTNISVPGGMGYKGLDFSKLSPDEQKALQKNGTLRYKDKNGEEYIFKKTTVKTLDRTDGSPTKGQMVEREVYIDMSKKMQPKASPKKIKEEEFSKLPVVGSIQRGCSWLADCLDEWVESVAPTKVNTLDGKDDGNIGWGEVLGSGLRAVKNAVTGMLRNPIKTIAIGTALVVANALLPGVGTALVYGGLALGAVTLGKGIYNNCTAKTDAESRAAWEDIWTGGITVATSAWGLKKIGAAKASAAKASAAKAAAGSVDDVGALNDKISALGKLQELTGSSRNVTRTLKGLGADKADDINSILKGLGVDKIDDLAALGIKKASDIGTKITDAQNTLNSMNTHSTGWRAVLTDNRVYNGAKDMHRAVFADSHWGGFKAFFKGGTKNFKDLNIFKNVDPALINGKGASMDKMNQLQQAFNLARGNGEVNKAARLLTEMKSVSAKLAATDYADDAIKAVNTAKALMPRAVTFKYTGILQGNVHSMIDNTTSLDGKKRYYEIYREPAEEIEAVQ